MKQETNLVKREKAGALSTNLFEQDRDAGFQNMGQEDFALPFLKVLVQLSPEVNDRNAKYVKNATPGMIYNTVTNEIYDGKEGIDVLPVFYERKLVEWQDRGDSQGKPVRIHDISSDIMSTTKREGSDYKDRLPNGNYIENTANHYIIKLNGVPSPALISMKATQLKVSRKWNSMMMGIKLEGKNGLFTPPTYSHIYKLKTIQMSNDKGTWFGWDVSKTGPIQSSKDYALAKGFARDLSKNRVRVEHQAPPQSEEQKPLPF